MQSKIQIRALFTTRSLFIILLCIVFVLLPLLSINAGISGDEPVHYQQGQFVNEYFQSGKTNLSALET
ncbi:MAG: hypothetical protein J7L96_04245, partial [Bacteroidales bacterium]|nr:hypothetical protein [Bacteroidales bacterium]